MLLQQRLLVLAFRRALGFVQGFVSLIRFQLSNLRSMGDRSSRGVVQACRHAALHWILLTTCVLR
jgi:hypothetical protein